MLLDQLQFPNGVQLSPEEDFVLVAETTMARIRRCVQCPLVPGVVAGGDQVGRVWGPVGALRGILQVEATLHKGGLPPLL